MSPEESSSVYLRISTWLYRGERKMRLCVSPSHSIPQIEAVRSWRMYKCCQKKGREGGGAVARYVYLLFLKGWRCIFYFRENYNKSEANRRFFRLFFEIDSKVGRVSSV